MNDVMILRRGGSGVKTGLPAIYVNYPPGSVCTCSNGDKSYTSKDNSGIWLFSGLELGEWTVTATDGTRTKSQSVSITAKGQIENVKLSYEYYLFNGGSIVDWTGTFGNTEYASSGYKIGTTLYVKRTGSSGHNMWAAVYTDEPVDISSYSRLVADISAASGSDIYLAVCKSAAADEKKEFAASADIVKGEVSVDISNLTGSYYITLNATYGQSGTASCTATAVRLE